MEAVRISQASNGFSSLPRELDAKSSQEATVQRTIADCRDLVGLTAIANVAKEIRDVHAKASHESSVKSDAGRTVAVGNHTMMCNVYTIQNSFFSADRKQCFYSCPSRNAHPGVSHCHRALPLNFRNSINSRYSLYRSCICRLASS